jgi:hypothetical protein
VRQRLAGCLVPRRDAASDADAFPKEHYSWIPIGFVAARPFIDLALGVTSRDAVAFLGRPASWSRCRTQSPDRRREFAPLVFRFALELFPVTLNAVQRFSHRKTIAGQASAGDFGIPMSSHLASVFQQSLDSAGGRARYTVVRRSSLRAATRPQGHSQRDK